MVITISRLTRRILRPAAGTWTALAIVLLPARAGATDWTVVPSVRLRESYSDNIRLAPPAQAQSDLVTEINPAVAISGNGPRLKLDLAFSLQTLIYARQPDALYPTVSATANAELLDDWLFVDARSNVGRQNISAFGPQAFDNLQRSDNQSNVYANSISPFVRHRFRSLATIEARYAHETVNSGDNFFDVNTDEVLLAAAGDNGGHGWNWDTRYQAKRSDDPALGSVVDSHTGSFSLHVPVASRLAMTGTVGYESQGYLSTALTPRGRLWAIGASWNPSPRSSLAASAGKRFFGNTYSLNASRRGRKAVWSINYDEDIRNSAGGFLNLESKDAFGVLNELWGSTIPDPGQRQLFINSFLNTSQLFGPKLGTINYFSHAFFLEKQLSVAVAALTAKSTLLFGLSSSRRIAQSDSSVDSELLRQLPLPFQLNLNDNTRQLGANAAWRWRMSPRTSVNLSARRDQVKSVSGGRTDNDLALGVGLSRALRTRVVGSVDFRRMRHTSTLSAAEYTENGIAASLIFQL